MSLTSWRAWLCCSSFVSFSQAGSGFSGTAYFWLYAAVSRTSPRLAAK